MFTRLNDEIFEAVIAETTAGVLICFKQNCPHCKNMEKVLEKFSKKEPDLKFYDLDSEENPKAIATLEAERSPTILVIKQGKVVARKPGLMNPKEMKAFYAAA